MKTRREEMRNVWCNEGGNDSNGSGAPAKSPYDQQLSSAAAAASLQELPPYSHHHSKSPPTSHHHPHHFAALSSFGGGGGTAAGFSLIPSLNLASLDKDDIAEESRDSESPISDVEITDD